MFDAKCYGPDKLATVEEAEDDLDPNDIEDVVAFSIKSLERFVILGGATKTNLGFTSVQPMADHQD